MEVRDYLFINDYWIFYDEKGNETHREYYKKGILINE